MNLYYKIDLSTCGEVGVRENPYRYLEATKDQIAKNPVVQELIKEALFKRDTQDSDKYDNYNEDYDTLRT